jgi:hypothetical protein
MKSATSKKNSREQELSDHIVDLAKRARLNNWNEFVEELKVPSELAPALITNRPELIRLAQPRALSADEAKALYTLIGALLETNMALREHAQGVATLAEGWVSSMNGAFTIARRIGRLAQFRHADAADDSEIDD